MVHTLEVVVRCRNEMPYAQVMLDMLQRQDGLSTRVLFIDCGSSDGSREAAQSRGCEIIDIEPAEYIPGRILNHGMERTDSDVVAFINADAIPIDVHSLRLLVDPLFQNSRLAAVYGRQLARPSADRITQADYSRAFGPYSELSVRRGRFFSMAASAISRAAWTCLPFDERLRYSEDIDWTHRISALGWGVRYVPTACFEHSHNYDLNEHYRRRFGEGAADKQIYRLGPPSWIRDWAKPLAGSLLRDLRSRSFTPHCVGVRVMQASGYFAGRRHTDTGSHH